MDHQKINWGLELAIEEIKKALDIPQEDHNKIVQELEDDFRQIEIEAYRREEVYGDDHGMNIYEDEGENSKCYNQNIVGKYAWIKWAADGKFKKVLIIDYDLENGAHELLHVEEKLYEWLNLNELLTEDVLWESPKEDNEKHVVSREAIYLYETSQLMETVEQVLSEPIDPNLLDEALNCLEEQKHFVDMALETITDKIDQLRDGGNNPSPEETDDLLVEEAIGEDEEGGDNGIKGAHNKGTDDSGGGSYDSSAEWR
ncbi:protein EMSY-LIKE 2 isoform X1 [Cryptomeria japonica]|uniref:protein EMSY-LIKE 2 isoform X1 n=1 Tax=Cryptomeria japonica TaxID=3369 RepID=UPI0027DA7ABD|nr:protein EMSY-LIKE 2 isoform X1 [Cryptomeria japonica]